MKFSKFFSKIQEAPWYRSFLNPVINEIDRKGKLLDIGTGSGKLIQILSTEKEIDCIGVDTNREMLAEAKNKLKGTNARIQEIKANENFPFDDNSFTYVSICNLLFHLDKESIDFVLKDARRVLKNKCKMIILTPTGKGNMTTLSKKYFSLNNLSIYIWFIATRNRAGQWRNNNYLKQYADKNKLHYRSQIVMNGFAQLEVLKE